MPPPFTPTRQKACKWVHRVLPVVLVLGCVAWTSAGDLVQFVDAVKENRLEEVRMLLSQGADINSQDMFDGNTGLHWAAMLGLADMARLLIDNNAFINARNDKEETPLHLAAGKGQKELLVILIAHKADINAVDQRGWSARRWADEHRQEEIARILVAAGAKR